MKELIKIKNENGNNLVSARELHKGLKITERFSTWFERMLQYGFEENKDFTGCKVFNTLANKELQDYAINIDMAKEIAMIQRSELGKKYRQYFLECEKQLKKVLPQDYKSALLALVAAEEEKEKLQLEKAHKQEVINGLTDNISVTTKKDIVNSVVKWKRANYRERYNKIYKSFKEIYHIDLKARCEGYNMKQLKQKYKLSTIKYAERMGYIDKLYDISCKLYESDVNEIKEFLGLIY